MQSSVAIASLMLFLMVPVEALNVLVGVVSPRLTTLVGPKIMWVKVPLDGAVMISLPLVLLQEMTLLPSGSLTREIVFSLMLLKSREVSILLDRPMCLIP